MFIKSTDSFSRRAFLTVVAALFSLPSFAQTSVLPGTRVRPRADCVVVPQSRVFATAGRERVEVTGVEARAVILEQVATTTMDIALRNPTNRILEAELLVPVPDDAVVRSFDFQGAAAEPTARILPREEAKSTYRSIVREARDPALLEFAGYQLVRSSVFPVEANGTQKVRLTFEHVLQADGARVDYVLPRSESLDYRIPWKISVEARAQEGISAVYSPSHALETQRTGKDRFSARIADSASRSPGAFRVSYLLDREGVTASLLAYPDATIGGGYFLLLAALPDKGKLEPKIKREVTLVLDRSGSMGGRKIEQAREAALQVLAGLEDGEAFNIIVYDATVELFSAKPVVKSRETAAKAEAFIRSIQSTGGTNLHAALQEALRQEPTEGMLPLVLFLTDGFPTVGQTSELAIRELAIKQNPHTRRVFTFGVGVGVNTPLLERVASVSRATANFILPDENVEVAVSRVFGQLSGPLLASPRLIPEDGNHRIRSMMPAELPDIFRGDQLVVLGRYRGGDPLAFVLQGRSGGENRSFRFSFELSRATTRNAFVSRLWASRQIAFLEDAIRDLGAENTGLVASATAAATSDPRLEELVDEIVKLSTEFGVLSEYTAFLANEGTDLSRRDLVLARASKNFFERSISCRSGLAGLNQDLNRATQKVQGCLNISNSYLDENLNRVEIAHVQQVADRAFYRRGGRWIDSRVVENEKIEPSRTVLFGTAEFRDLLERLTREGRQGCISLKGDIVLEVDGERVLVPEIGDGC